MNKRESENSAAGYVAVIGCILIFIAAVVAGYWTAPDENRVPVMLADGEVIMQPYYVAADGRCIALVEDLETAQNVVAGVKASYENDSTVRVEIEETTTIGEMDIKNGAEKPEILSTGEAKRRIVNNGSLTVKTTEVIEEEHSVEYKTIEKETDELKKGVVRVEQEGENGIARIKKSVVKENGKIVSEDIMEHEVVKESVPEIIVSGTAGMIAPLDSLVITSGYGPRWGRQHEGIDFGVPEGTPIYAVLDGTVTFADYTEGFGNLVILKHADGLETYYAHCSRIDVVYGQAVETGHQIAAVGSTGNSTGPHLHFEVHEDGAVCDPSEWIDVE